MNAITSSGRKTKVETRVPPFVATPLEDNDKPALGVTKATLVKMIRAAWLAVGVDLLVEIREDGEISSDTLNGLPRCHVISLQTRRSANG